MRTTYRIGLFSAALALAACSGLTAPREPDDVVPPEEGVVVLSSEGVEVRTLPPTIVRGQALRTHFLAKVADGSAGDLVELAVEAWVDADRDGQRGDGERSARWSVREPAGAGALWRRVDAPYEPGVPAMFALRFRRAGERVGEVRGVFQAP